MVRDIQQRLEQRVNELERAVAQLELLASAEASRRWRRRVIGLAVVVVLVAGYALYIQRVTNLM